jgi:cobalt-zinc-cadmium efflux system protein
MASVGHHHNHADGHQHGPPIERSKERRRLALTLMVTAAILVLEIIGGLWARSLSLLSDAGHMFSDVVAQGLSLMALIIAARPADSRRTYGWYRLEILAALVNGLTLLTLAGFILWEGLQRLRAPVEVHTPVMIATAAIGLVANLIGAWLLHGLTSLNARGAYLHLLLDTLSSVAVLTGGIVMFFARGLYWVDPMLSMVIGVFVLYSAYWLIRDAVDVLLETVPREIDLAGVTHAIDRIEGVQAVHDLHIWTITSGLYALSAHIVVAGDEAGPHDALLNRVQEVLLREFRISHTTLQIESEEHEHLGRIC